MQERTITIGNLAFRYTCIGPVIYGDSFQHNPYEHDTFNIIMEHFDLQRVWFTAAMGVELGYDEIAGTDSDDTAYRKSLHPKDQRVDELLEKVENKDNRWTIPNPWKKMICH